MPSVVVVAEVEDVTKWERGFRTHGELFKKQTAKTVRYGTTDQGSVAVHFEVDDLATCMGILETPETAAAMEFDGIKRETVRVFVLDNELAP